MTSTETAAQSPRKAPSRPRVVLSPDQQRAVDHVLQWFEQLGRPRLTLGGYAGTGKSTVVDHIVRAVGSDNVAVCAYTGKAASVLRRKGVEDASTLHRLIYTVLMYCKACDGFLAVDADICSACKRGDALVVRYKRVPLIARRLVIVDEASMLNAAIIEDLEEVAYKVLYVGDHGQLQPIGKDPGIMRDPEIRLEMVHRQAAGSPIIRFAHQLRRGALPATWTEDAPVRVRVGLRHADLASYDALLCGYNRTRVALNRKVRKLRGFAGTPREGERLICLQNDRDLGVFNGMLATITKIRGSTPDVFMLDLEDEVGQRFPNMPVLRSQFHREQPPSGMRMYGVGLFDFGYAMTVHKAQGSEWNRVAVLEQLGKWNAARWRYTAVTRAVKELDYFLSDGRTR